MILAGVGRELCHGGLQGVPQATSRVPRSLDYPKKGEGKKGKCPCGGLGPMSANGKAGLLQEVSGRGLR